MPTSPTYPGVYIEEVPSGVRTISGVATSIAAFVGYFSRGPMNEAVRIFNFGDFEREFGGLRADSEAAYAIQQFFLNGGGQAYVVRVAIGAQSAAIVLEDSANGAPTEVLLALAISVGDWGNNLRLEVDYDTSDPPNTFNLTVVELGEVNGVSQAVSTAVFRNLNLDAASSRYALDVVNAGSSLVEIALPDPGSPPAASARPAHSGTLSTALGDVTTLIGTEATTVSITGGGSEVITLTQAPTSPAALAADLQAVIRDVVDTSFEAVTVRVVGSSATEQYLRVSAGTTNPEDIVSFSDAGGNTLAGLLGLNAAARTNVQSYELGSATAVAAQALPGNPAAQQQGSDGALPGANELMGNQGAKTGMHALLDVDLFNILCIPDTMRLADAAAAQVASEATTFCEQERAFYILDVPQPANPLDEPAEIQQWLDDNSTLRHRNAALYYPRPSIPDALNEFRLREIAPSGTIAGLYARTDGTRGVWKAPAGTEASLRGVQRLEYKLTDDENGVLNPLAINCLRSFPIYGNVAWGARTLDGADQSASEWKYIPVRRLALFLEESLFRGTQWVVFEPNDEPLWAQIRLNLGAFMHNLFRQGAFQGMTPKDAYFVKCDSETTTQNDINLGIVNIVVGFAPLKPAEFVIIKIQQIAGQLET